MTRHDPVVAVRHMVDYAKKAIEFVGGQPRAAIEADAKSTYAIVHALEILGEAARRVPKTIQDANPQVPWPDIIGMRNVLAHGYDTVSWDEVWRTLTEDLPVLLPTLETLLRTLERSKRPH